MPKEDLSKVTLDQFLDELRETVEGLRSLSNNVMHEIASIGLDFKCRSLGPDSGMLINTTYSVRWTPETGVVVDGNQTVPGRPCPTTTTNPATP